MKQTIHSPANLLMLLHFYVWPQTPYPKDPIVLESDGTKQQWLDEGIIEPTDPQNPSLKECYRTTALGDSWVYLILACRLPRQVFVDEQNRVISKDYPSFPRPNGNEV